MCPEVVQSDSALDHTCLEELQESWMDDIMALVLEPTKGRWFQVYYVFSGGVWVRRSSRIVVSG